MANCRHCANQNDCSLYEPHSMSACSKYKDIDDNTKKFKIEIRETLSRTIEVEAESVEDAMDTVRAMYHNQDIVLDSEDFDFPAEIHALDKNYEPITEWESV